MAAASDISARARNANLSAPFPLAAAQLLGRAESECSLPMSLCAPVVVVVVVATMFFADWLGAGRENR